MLIINLPEGTETHLVKFAARTGKTVDTIAQAAFDLYLEEMEDYLDVAEIRKKEEGTISLEELGKSLGLEG